MGKHNRISDLADGTVVEFDDGEHVSRGIVCRPPHLDEAVVFTPHGYVGLTSFNERYWSVVPDADEEYLSDAWQAEREFRQRFTALNNGSRR